MVSLLSVEIGDAVRHGAAYSWLQKSSQTLRQGEDQRWKAVFEDDEAFEGEIDEKEIVVDEMGAAMLHSQKRAEEAHREAGCYGKCQLFTLIN